MSGDEPAVGVDLKRIERRWEELTRDRVAAEQRFDQLRQIAAWWDPWIAGWRRIGEAVALPVVRSILLDLIAGRCAQLEIARDRRIAEAEAWAGVYPICRSCGHRMLTRDHRCAP